MTAENTFVYIQRGYLKRECRECRRRKRRDWGARNREHIKTSNTEYWTENKDRINAKRRKSV